MQPTLPADFACRICGSRAGERFIAREMMFATRQPFEYFECGECGCVQIIIIPADLGPFYPRQYYSFQVTPTATGWRRWLRRRRNAAAFLGRGWLGPLLALCFPYPLPRPRDWFRLTRAGIETRILDVGCGRGELLRDLGDVGFTRLQGIDPFLAEDVLYANGARVSKASIEEVAGPFDLIMMHHSLEHVPDHISLLREAARLLAPNAWLLIRTPTTSSWAWRRYRENWVQLDPPRHLLLHSVKSLRIAAARAGLTLEHVVFDSKGFQFMGSELYRRDLGLEHIGWYGRLSRCRFGARAWWLNKRHRGDQAAFYLRRES